MAKQVKTLPIENMKVYIGTKQIKALPTNKKDYCDYRGWKVPKDEDPKEEIYLVEYPVDVLSKPNHKNHEGYISMSPKHVFDKAYKAADTYLDRLVIERDELAIKVDKLTTAMKEHKVPASAVELLRLQKRAMNQYLNILNKRLEA